MAVSTDPWVSVQIEEPLKRYLEIRAGLEGCTRSEMIRTIIKADAKKAANKKIHDLAIERSSS